MIIVKKIVATKKPETSKEVISFFEKDERIKGKKLKSFSVLLDIFGTDNNDFIRHNDFGVNNYKVIAVFN